MASPQPDQFTRVSNELLEALCGLQLSGSEWSFIHTLIRKTYGYNKKEDWITNTQIMSMTGLGKERVSEAKKSLISKNIVTEKRNKIGLQKDYEKWTELRKNVTIVTEKRNLELRKNVTTIDNKEKRNISDKSLLLKETNQNNDMAWKKYNEDGHNDYTPSIDLDSGETITDEQTKQTEENRKITNNLKVLAEYRGLPFADVPTQRKKYHEVLKLGYNHVEIAEEYVKLIDSPYWKEQRTTTKLLPDMKSLHSGLKNKTK